MTIISAKIDWLMHLGNLPRLVITVDQLPDFDADKPIYTRQRNGMVYAIKEGFVDFVSMGAPTESGIVGGFAGRELTRTLTDGTVLKSRECWSGNSDNMEFECMEVRIYETESKYPALGTASAVTYELAKRLIDEMDGVHLFKYELVNVGSKFWVASRSPTEYIKELKSL